MQGFFCFFFFYLFFCLFVYFYIYIYIEYNQAGNKSMRCCCIKSPPPPLLLPHPHPSFPTRCSRQELNLHKKSGVTFVFCGAHLSNVRRGLLAVGQDYYLLLFIVIIIFCGTKISPKNGITDCLKAVVFREAVWGGKLESSIILF